jgi:hypothetical protein
MEIVDAQEFLKHNHHGVLVARSATVSAAMPDDYQFEDRSTDDLYRSGP